MQLPGLPGYQTSETQRVRSSRVDTTPACSPDAPSSAVAPSAAQPAGSCSAGAGPWTGLVAVAPALAGFYMSVTDQLTEPGVHGVFSAYSGCHPPTQELHFDPQALCWDPAALQSARDKSRWFILGAEREELKSL